MSMEHSASSNLYTQQQGPAGDPDEPQSVCNMIHKKK